MTDTPTSLSAPAAEQRFDRKLEAFRQAVEDTIDAERARDRTAPGNDRTDILRHADAVEEARQTRVREDEIRNEILAEYTPFTEGRANV